MSKSTIKRCARLAALLFLLSPALLGAAVTDLDDDGEDNLTDNCLLEPNAGQGDADADGTGDACDCDLDQNNTCGFSDFITFLGCFGESPGAVAGPAEDPGCFESDQDGNGTVGFTDFELFLKRFGGPPGPPNTDNDGDGVDDAVDPIVPYLPRPGSEVSGKEIDVILFVDASSTLDSIEVNGAAFTALFSDAGTFGSKTAYRDDDAVPYPGSNEVLVRATPGPAEGESWRFTSDEPFRNVVTLADASIFLAPNVLNNGGASNLIFAKNVMNVEAGTNDLVLFDFQHTPITIRTDNSIETIPDEGDFFTHFHPFFINTFIDSLKAFIQPGPPGGGPEPSFHSNCCPLDDLACPENEPDVCGGGDLVTPDTGSDPLLGDYKTVVIWTPIIFGNYAQSEIDALRAWLAGDPERRVVFIMEWYRYEVGGVEAADGFQPRSILQLLVNGVFEGVSTDRIPKFRAYVNPSASCGASNPNWWNRINLATDVLPVPGLTSGVSAVAAACSTSLATKATPIATEVLFLVEIGGANQRLGLADTITPAVP